VFWFPSNFAPHCAWCSRCLSSFSTRRGRLSARQNITIPFINIFPYEIADKLARDGSVQRFVGPEPFLGVSRENIRRKMKSRMEKQHLARWRGLGSIQRQARELISGLNPAAKTRLLSFDRTQSRVVIGLLTGHNTLRRHLYRMGLSNNPTCRKCGTGEETSIHFCVSVKLWFHSNIHIWVPSFWTLRISGN